MKLNQLLKRKVNNMSCNACCYCMSKSKSKYSEEDWKHLLENIENKDFLISTFMDDTTEPYSNGLLTINEIILIKVLPHIKKLAQLVDSLSIETLDNQLENPYKYLDNKTRTNSTLIQILRRLLVFKTESLGSEYLDYCSEQWRNTVENMYLSELGDNPSLVEEGVSSIIQGIEKEIFKTLPVDGKKNKLGVL